MPTCKSCQAGSWCTMRLVARDKGCNYYQPRNRRSKFNNRIVKADGYTFQSQAEADEYLRLKDREQRGEIINLRVHPVYVLVEKWVDEWGNKYPREVYIADFDYEIVVSQDDGPWIRRDKPETCEVKGVDLLLGRLKRRMAIELGKVRRVRIVWARRGRR